MVKTTRYKGKEAQFAALLVTRGIYEIWHPYGLTDYEDPNSYVPLIKTHVQSKSPKGVLMHGPNGTGKTMLLNVTFKDMNEVGRSAYVIDFRDLVKEYTRSWRDNGNIKALMDCDCLGIDDIGKEFSESGVSKELAITALDYVIRHRFQRNLPTWITTNLQLSEFDSEYGGHIASLLRRSMTSLFVDGEDYGKKLFKKLGEPQQPETKKKGKGFKS